MTQTLGPRPKLRVSSELQVVLALAGICTTLQERGLIWTGGSDRNQFRNWLDGRRPQAGEKVSGHGRRESRKHPLKRAQETAPVTNTMEMITRSMAMFCAGLKGWKK